MNNKKKSLTALSTHAAVLGSLKNRLFLVLFLTLADTVLSSLGIGMVLPVFQALLNPLHKNALLSDILPFMDTLEPNMRLISIAAVTVIVFFIKASITMWTAVVSNTYLQQLRFKWVACIGEIYLQAPLLDIASRKQGDLLNDWFNESLTASRFYKSSLKYLSSTSLAFALIVLGLIVNWQAMVSMIAVGTVAVIFVRKLTYKRSEFLSKEKLKVNQALNSAMVENLGNVRDLKLLSAEKHRLGIIAELSTKLKSIFVHSAVLAEIPRVSGEFLAVLLLMGFTLISVILFGLSAESVLPMIAFFFLAFYRLVTASSVAMTSRIKALNDWHSVKRIQELINDERHKENFQLGRPIAKIDSDICFDNVVFHYNQEKCGAKAERLVIPLGKMTLLVGPSGSGKSTLLDLLMRLVEPTNGVISMNGTPAPNFGLADWRRCFGYVSQDAALFNGSIRMNMLLAEPEANDNEIQKACRIAGADDFIKGLPMGYDTIIGDRGFSLSGGQRKRLAIARAIIRRPSVIILDEATTSFEQSLEKQLLNRLRDEFPELTIILVTHRIENTENVDWIVIMENGDVVANGAKHNIVMDNYGYH